MCTCLNVLTNTHVQWHECRTNHSFDHPFRLALAAQSPGLLLVAQCLLRLCLTAVVLQLVGLGQVKGQSAAYRAQISTLRNENEMLARKVSDLNHHITANDGSRAAITALQGFSVSRLSLVSVHAIRASCNQ